jgi:hypothetical protein
MSRYEKTIPDHSAIDFSVFYYLSASEIWLDKRDGFGGSGHLR